MARCWRPARASGDDLISTIHDTEQRRAQPHRYRIGLFDFHACVRNGWFSNQRENWSNEPGGPSSISEITILSPLKPVASPNFRLAAKMLSTLYGAISCVSGGWYIFIRERRDCRGVPGHVGAMRTHPICLLLEALLVAALVSIELPAQTTTSG
jgi:hypothetical protein